MAPTFPIYAQFNMTDHHSMHKRALPLIPILGALAVGTAGANIGSSVVNGGAPLSWFGKPLGAMFGFADAADVQRIVTQLTTVSTALTSLQVDSMETRQAINDMAAAQRVFNQKILKAFHATTAVMLEIDLKSFIRYLITVIDSHAHKITTIGLAASTGRATSLALTSTELAIVADRQLKTKNIKLSTNLEQVKMSMLKLNKKIMLIFNIPILVEENLYHFYKVDAIPLFENNTMYIPEIDAPFIGISKSGSDYVTVTAEEYTRCTTDPSLCTVSSPSYPMTSEAHCSVTTYVTGNMTCALIESDKPPIRYVHISGNHTIFSVPEETLVYIKCDDPKSAHKSLETTLILKNMGQATFRPGCTVNFPDGTKFLTPALYPSEKIDDSKLFQLLTVYSIPKNARIRRFYNPPEENQSHLPDHKDLDVSFRMPTIAEFKQELLNPTKTLVFVLKATLFAVCIVAAFSLCCCYWPPIRMCLGNSWFCCCFKKVDSVPHPIPRERIKSILKSGLTKAKSTSDLLLSSASKYAPVFPRNNLNPSSRSPVEMSKFWRSSPAVNAPPSDSDDDMVVIQKDRIKMVYEPSKNEIQDPARVRFLPTKESLL
jgi:hypothetical protein